ncbi:MAG: sterol desaturase family protein, partial [Polyangiaceae bacterium]
MPNLARTALVDRGVNLHEDMRNKVREKANAEIPSWYSPLLHLLFPSTVGIACIVLAATQLHSVAPLELLLVPLVYLISNAAEWRAHKHLLHKRTPPLQVLYDRHTPQHHMIFVTHDMSIRARREWRLVLIPFYGVLTILAVTVPGAIALALSGQRNLGALFVMTTTFYVLSYEWLHLAYHMPPDSFVGKIPGIATLRRHHAT